MITDCEPLRLQMVSDIVPPRPAWYAASDATRGVAGRVSDRCKCASLARMVDVAQETGKQGAPANR
jgi:hypothetical protein